MHDESILMCQEKTLLHDESILLYVESTFACGESNRLCDGYSPVRGVSSRKIRGPASSHATGLDAPHGF
jgi:hypothetical protein